MTEDEKQKIINTFNEAMNRKIANESTYGKLASKEMFENKQEIKTEISTDCSYYKDVVKNEIIIDGVDISGCMFLCKNTAGHICCGDDIREDKIPFANFCQENKDCYYKQLQGIKQQNLELIERANAYPKIVILANERLNEIARLEQENNSLQAQVNNITVQSNNAITALEQENKDLKKEIAELRKDCNHCNFHTYRSALEEINRVVKLAHKVEDYLLGQDYTDLVDRIENKINEVLK